MGERGGELRITAKASTPTLLTIDVADTGPGIPEQVRGSLFEPFAGSSKADGNGLGLAICRELMQRAWRRDRAGRNVRAAAPSFRLRLPGA